MILIMINYKFFDWLIHRIDPESLIADKSSCDDSAVAYLDVLVLEIIVLVQNVYHKVDYFRFHAWCWLHR